MSRRGLESTVVARLGTSQPQRTPGNTEEIPSAVLLRDLCGSEFRRPPARRWCPNSALIAKRLGGMLCVWCGRACRRRGTLDCQRLTFAPVPRSKPQSVVEWNHRGIPCVHSVASRSQPEWLPACWGGGALPKVYAAAQTSQALQCAPSPCTFSTRGKFIRHRRVPKHPLMRLNSRDGLAASLSEAATSHQRSVRTLPARLPG